MQLVLSALSESLMICVAVRHRMMGEERLNGAGVEEAPQPSCTPTAGWTGLYSPTPNLRVRVSGCLVVSVRLTASTGTNCT